MDPNLQIVSDKMGEDTCSTDESLNKMKEEACANDETSNKATATCTECCRNVSSFSSSVSTREARLQKIFLTGFRECHQESLHYLVDHEHIPVDASIIVGLDQHLLKIEQMLSFAHDMPPHISNNEPQNQHSSPNDFAADSKATESPELSQIDDSIVSNLQNSFDSALEASATSFNSSTIAELDSTLDRTGEEVINSVGEEITESELIENAYHLMHLAQNNPNINNILNELFVLMDEEDDIDVDDGVELDESSLNSDSEMQL